MIVCQIKGCAEAHMKHRADAIKKRDRAKYDRHNGHLTSGHYLVIYKPKWEGHD